MTLLELLRGAGLVSGPLLSENTSNSGLSSIKLLLFGERPSEFKEQYLIFGNSTHLHALTDSKNWHKPLTRGERDQVVNMVTNYREHTVVKTLMANSVREKKRYVVIHEVMFAVILDIEQPHASTGADLKTTTAKTLTKFLEKAIELDYFRQGLIYKLARKLDHFYFIGLGKEPPYPVMIFRIEDYPEEMEYAKQELELLTYIFKHYGKPTWKKS